MALKIRIYRANELLSETEGIMGESVLDRVNASGIFLDAPCGGKGRCGKCLVRLSPDGEQVRACRTYINVDTDIYLPAVMDMKIAGSADTAPAEDATAFKGTLGVAIDIGTTTVVAHLTEMATGKRIATASGVNAQRPYGADVISRIQYCSGNGHETLSNLIRDQILTLIQKTCAASGAKIKDIRFISIAANTIMEHLAAGLSPVGMGVAPFSPVSLFGDELSIETGLGTSAQLPRDAIVYFAPAISSYVGGDITAGMLAAGLESDDGPTVYLDIGTNGEIAMKVGNEYYCCATAAGPAFEGAEISMGMAAVSGAVSHVKWDNGLDITVIGGTEPLGLCGSGLLDSLALLIKTGAVDESGRLLDPDEISHPIKEHITQGADGKNVFLLTRDGGGVSVSAADIRKLQLAKAAIAAGIQTLLHHSGFKETDVASFLLAGGFGSYMDKESAAGIGLFPKSFLPVAKTMGNTAGEGAALALRREARAALGNIRERCRYIELSTSVYFNEQFIEQMMFE